VVTIGQWLVVVFSMSFFIIIDILALFVLFVVEASESIIRWGLAFIDLNGNVVHPGLRGQLQEGANYEDSCSPRDGLHSTTLGNSDLDYYILFQEICK
jgi:hypothetical protein